MAPGSPGATSSTTTPPAAAVLYSSPTTSDDWQPVDVGRPLTDIRSMAVASGLVAIVDSDGLQSTLYLSPDGVTWEPQQACPDDTQPSSLSTTADASTGAGSLWVTCTNATTSVIRTMDTSAWGEWAAVPGTFGPGVMIAARTVHRALVAGPGITGIERVSTGKEPKTVYDKDVGAPVYFAFTNPTYGYLLDSTGTILSTSDGGGSWSTYQVGATKP
jgi:hypothetical protein